MSFSMNTHFLFLSYFLLNLILLADNLVTLSHFLFHSLILLKNLTHLKLFQWVMFPLLWYLLTVCLKLYHLAINPVIWHNLFMHLVYLIVLLITSPKCLNPLNRVPHLQIFELVPTHCPHSTRRPLMLLVL